MRRTLPTIVYARAGKLVAMRHALGHSSYSTTVAYVGVEAEDAMRVVEENSI
jgi:hypothetical protein